MKKNLVYTRKWYPDLEIKEEHKNLPIRQVTCFVMTKDDKILLVSKDGDSWSVTAGHYEEKKDPTYLDTALREVYEESGLDISALREDIKWLGYYVIEDVDADSKKVLDTYLQIRTYLILDKISEEIILKPIEGDLVKYAKFSDTNESMKLIKWLEKSPEWEVIRDILS
jgi:8-oxo-dGTP pyrophosphatase MutT (NUDIX family)